jgi:CheY-like chemotaxis protein
VVLIVENDLGFARLLLETAREKGFKGLATSLGATALALAREYKPRALTLDIFLPDIDGWRVLNRLKNDVLTRHVPVCVISTDDARERALLAGALSFLAKPIQTKERIDELFDDLQAFLDRERRSLLVVEPDATRRERIVESLSGGDIDVLAVTDGGSAQRLLAEQPIDCLVINPQTPALSAIRRPLPVIVYSEGEGEESERMTDGGWRTVDGDVLPVRHAGSPERLLDQAARFLHQDLARLPEEQRRTLVRLHASDKVLAGKKVLIVDDDIRNIFALSTVLEEHDMVLVWADNGRDAIKTLRQQQDIDIVLMDIMMPEMDGIDTLREVRKIERLRTLPIVAVTAKAMKGDREKCIEAGAWDYLSKPVDTEQMLSVLRAWLHR